MKYGDYIRNMNNQRLASFLFMWGINTLTSFMEAGGMEVMNAKELREWMEKEDFKCRQTQIGKDFMLNDDFSIKQGDKTE